jgi:hypothetical protein
MGYGRRLRRDQASTSQADARRGTPGSTAGMRPQTMSDEDYLRQLHRSTAVIAGAMMFALAVYALLVAAIQYGYLPMVRQSTGGIGNLREGALLVGLIVFVVIRSSRKSMLKRNPDDTAKALVNKFRTATIITFALCEVPAIAGLVLFFLGGPAENFYILALYSSALMVIYFPQVRHWQAWIQKPTGMY